MSLRVVNFGSAKTGLATVGYTIYGVDGSVISSRSTTGVNELGSTGVYAADISLPGYDSIVLWDTGEATPRYATESYVHTIDYIGGEVEKLQKIWNSIKNQGEFMAAFMDKLGLLAKNEGLEKVNKDIEALSQREAPPSLTNIEEAFKKAVGDVKLEVKSQKIPDYSAAIKDVKDIIMNIANDVVRIPKSQKEYTKNFDGIIQILSTLERNLKADSNRQSQSLTNEINKLKVVFMKFDSLLIKMGDLQDKLKSLDSNDKDIINSREQITKEIRRLNQYIYDFVSSPYIKEAKDASHILMAFGNKR